MINVNLDRIAAVVRQLASIAAVVVGALGTGGLPGGVREGLVLVGGALIGVEHAVATLTKPKTTTGTTTLFPTHTTPGATP